MCEVEQPGGRDRPVRRPDAAEARRRAARGRGPDPRHEHRRDRPRRGPRPLRRAARPARLQGAAVRDRARRRARRSRSRRRSASRCSCGPSYVLGGRAMEIVYSVAGLEDYLERVGAQRRRPRRSTSTASSRTRSRSTSTRSATATDVWIAGIMQHVEEAGIHSGDSACVLPPHALGDEMLEQIREQTERDRARRSASSACSTSSSRSTATRPARDRGQPARLADGAVRLQGDRAAARQARLPGHARRAARRPRPARSDTTNGHVCVKEVVLPFDRFAGADSLLGPEMRSTGEVMGIARDFPTAFAKAQAAAGAQLPSTGTVFITVADGDKPAATGIATPLHDLGFEIVATRGTAQAIRRMGIPAEAINKIGEGSPHVVDWIERGEVDLVINTPIGTGARDRRLRDPHRRRRPRDPLHHDDGRRDGRRPRDRGRAPRRAGGALAAGDPRATAGQLAREQLRSSATASGAVRPALAPVTARERYGAYVVLRCADPDGPRAAGRASSTCSARADAVGRRRGRAAVPAARVQRPAGAGGRRRAAVPDRGRRARDQAALRARRRATGCCSSGRSGIGFAAAARRSAPAAGRRRRRDRAAGDLAGRGSAVGATGRCSASATRAHAAGAALLARRARSPPTTAASAITAWSPSCSTDELDGGRRTAEVYACGPPAMLEAVRLAVRRARASPAQLALESGMACGFGACFGCVVPTRDGYVRLCIDGRCSTPRRSRPRWCAGAGIERRVLRHRARAPGHQRLGHVRRDRRAARVRRRAARALPVRRVRVQDGHARAARGQPAAAAVGAAGGDDQLDRAAEQGARRVPARTCRSSRELPVPLIVNVMGFSRDEVADARRGVRASATRSPRSSSTSRARTSRPGS